MLASRKKQSRSRTRATKKDIDPPPPDDPASRPTRRDYHRFLTTHPGVVEELLITLRAYLHDLVVSETLLIRLGTARSAEEQKIYTRRLAANVQARTAQLATLRILLAFLADQQADDENEPPVSIH